MAYKYRNVKTNETITTTNKVSGKNWEPLEDDILEDDFNEDETPKDETPEDEIFEDETPEVEDPEATVEEVPAAKPKTSRRGKK